MLKKSAKIRQMEEHLHVVQLEQSLKNNIVKEAQKIAVSSGLTELSANETCSRSIVTLRLCPASTSAQQPDAAWITVLSGAQELWPVWCVCCEDIPKQVNFLIEEAHLVSKGSNAAISFLDLIFARYMLGETDASLHCYNCAGQNKNRFMLWYCAWRVLTGQHRSISLHFLGVGHTKFALTGVLDY